MIFKNIHIKEIVLILSIILLAILVGYSYYKESNTIFSNPIIDEIELQRITNSRTKAENHIKFYYNGEVIPYIESEDYYLLSKNQKKDYFGTITNKENYKIVFIKPNKNIEELMESNEGISLVAYNEDSYKIIELKLTNLPVISISSESTKDENTFGTITLFDSNGDGRGNMYDIEKYNCRYHIRGAMTKASDKKSYKLNILSKKGNSKKVSMLGMRKDNDWILNPIAYDYSCMREKIGYDIWNNLSSVYNHKMEYIELVIDSEYVGVYYLKEPVDKKTFSATDNDFLFSIRDWSKDIEKRKLFSTSANDIVKQMYVDEFTFEDIIKSDKNVNVELLRKFVSNYDDIPYDTNTNLQYNIENNANYELFINLIYAQDNTYKNEKILFRRKQNLYLVEKAPWDLDISMFNEKFISLFHINRIIEDTAIPSEIRSSSEYKEQQISNYSVIRKKIYNEDTLNTIIDNYKEYLLQSGTIKRNNLKWNTEMEKFEDSCNNLKEFFKQRISVLDNYYGGI